MGGFSQTRKAEALPSQRKVKEGQVGEVAVQGEVAGVRERAGEGLVAESRPVP